MENFFANENFYKTIEELVEDMFNDDHETINNLPDDYNIKVEMSNLEPIFNINAQYLVNILCDNNEERLGDLDDFSSILEAFNKSVDFDMLKVSLPKYNYPNNIFKIITKQDLLDSLV